VQAQLYIFLLYTSGLIQMRVPESEREREKEREKIQIIRRE